MACKKPHKSSLEQAAANFPIETQRTAIERWPEHLQLCIEKEGNHFE